MREGGMREGGEIGSGCRRDGSGLMGVD